MNNFVYSSKYDLNSPNEFHQHNSEDDDCVWCMMSDTSRRNILKMLSNGALPRDEIKMKLENAGFKINDPNLSSHLRKLRDCGMIQRKKNSLDTRKSLYLINVKQLVSIHLFIIEFINNEDEGFLRLIKDKMPVFKENIDYKQAKTKQAKTKQAKTKQAKTNDLQ